MSRFNKETDSGSGIAFRDVIFTALIVILVINFLLLIMPKKPDEASNESDRSRGNIRVEVFWPDDMDVDIDLWGQSPGQPPIGYSNMQSPVMNLVRDDLGNYADITGINYEVMFSRGLPAGEWIFNIHWFGNSAGVSEVPVNVIVTYRKDDGTNSKEKPTQISVQQIMLTKVGQETTAIRFKLNADGDIIWDSLSSINKPIRSLPDSSTHDQ